MSEPLDAELWSTVERELGRPIPEKIRNAARTMRSSPVSRWLGGRTTAEKASAVALLIWHLEGVLALIDAGGVGANGYRDEARGWADEPLGPLPGRWEDTYATLVWEGWVTHLLSGKSRAVRTSEYVVHPIPERWKEHSRQVLASQEKLQREALWRVRRIGAAEWTDMTFAGHPPPPPLETSDFVPEDELETFLFRLRDSGDESGERDGIWYPDPEKPGAKKALEYGVKLKPECERQWLGNHNPLDSLKRLCGQFREVTGIAEDGAIAFLLCNADVFQPWFGFMIQLDNGPAGGRILLRIGTPDLPVGLVEHWYRLVRDYTLRQQNDPGAYTVGEETFSSDFLEWVEAGERQHPRPERTERDLLVEFVRQRREDGMGWAEILSAWNRFRPSAAYRNVASIRSVYQRAKRRLD